jgi:hypothetical protein
MSPKNLLRKLIAARWSIVDQHEEIDEKAFSVTGSLIHSVNRKRYNFDFHSMPDEGHYVLDMIERN